MKKSKRILSLLFFAVFAVSTALLIRNVLGYFQGAQADSEAQALIQSATISADEAASKEDFVVDEASSPEETSTTVTYWTPVKVEDDDVITQLYRQDLSTLRERNPDVLGWIRIPSSKIDYPLVQGEDNEFYLERNWRGEKLNVGSIFMECKNSSSFTNFNTILYGHNVANGSMFGSLRQYGNQAYADSHPYIYILTDWGVLRYEVFSSYTTTIGTQTYRLSFRESETREEYLKMAAELSVIDMGITPATTDLILTLSTCHGVGETRWIVHARLPMEEITIAQSPEEG